MAISTTEGTTSSIGTTEYSLVNNSTSLATDTTDAIVTLVLDCSALTIADSFVLKVYDKIISGGSKKVLRTYPLRSNTPSFEMSSLILCNGWDLTVTKIAGTDRAFDFSIRMAA